MHHGTVSRAKGPKTPEGWGARTFRRAERAPQGSTEGGWNLGFRGDASAPPPAPKTKRVTTATSPPRQVKRAPALTASGRGTGGRSSRAGVTASSLGPKAGKRHAVVLTSSSPRPPCLRRAGGRRSRRHARGGGLPGPLLQAARCWPGFKRRPATRTASATALGPASTPAGQTRAAARKFHPPAAPGGTARQRFRI